MKTNKLLKFSFFALLTIGVVLGFIYLPAYSFADSPNLVLGVMITGIIDTDRSRAAYNRCKNTAQQVNATFGGNIIVNLGYVHSENVITDQDSEYEFTLDQKTLQVNAGTRPLQRGVRDNDIFIAIGARLLIDNRTAGESDVIPQTYPNVFHFTTGVNTGNATHLYSFYNGEWSLQVGSTVYIPNAPTREFMLTPDAQKSSINNETAFDGNRYVSLDPYPVFSGKSDNKLKVKIDTFSGFAAAALTGENVLTFEFIGFTAQNAAGYMDFFTGSSNIVNEMARQYQNNELNKERKPVVQALLLSEGIKV